MFYAKRSEGFDKSRFSFMLEKHCYPSDIHVIQIHNANRVRQAMGPADPDDLAFDLDEGHIPPNFLVADIRKSGRRHIILATPEQLALLSRAKTWYVDGTFYVVKEPFYQLFSVHAFIKSDGTMKQVPLVYAIMSGKAKNDYKMVSFVIL